MKDIIEIYAVLEYIERMIEDLEMQKCQLIEEINQLDYVADEEL